MKKRDSKGFLLFTGTGTAAVLLGFVAFGWAPFSGSPPPASAEGSSAGQPWEAPENPCADPDVRAEAEALRDAEFESKANSTLALPEEVAPMDRSSQETAWRSLNEQQLAVEHCLSALGAGG